MTNLINTSLGPPLESLGEHANMVSSNLQQGFTLSDFCKEFMYQLAKEAVRVTKIFGNIVFIYGLM
jgi:hypothetical protein